MKRTSTVVFLLMVLTTAAQNRASRSETAYLNEQLKGTSRKQALHTCTVEPAPEGYQVQCLYENGKVAYTATYRDRDLQVRNGPARFYHEHGGVQAAGNYVEGKKDGLWRYWHGNGQLKDSVAYAKDFPIGELKSWHPNGKLQQQLQYRSIIINTYNPKQGTGSSRISGSEMDGPYVLYYPNGTIEARGAYQSNRPIGKWSWYRTNGLPSTEEYYNLFGKLDSMRCYDSIGNYAGSNCGINRPALLKGLGNLATHLASNFAWPDSVYRLKRPSSVRVLLEVNEVGKISSLRVESAERMLAESVHRYIRALPDWEPAVSHNRTIPWRDEITIEYDPARSRILREAYQNRRRTNNR